MSYTTEIFDAILRDVQQGGGPSGGSATRKIEFSGGISIIYSISIPSMRREVFITICKPTTTTHFPRWHGISIDIARLPVYGNEEYYIHLMQLPESEDYIFDVVVEDIRNSIKKLTSLNDCAREVANLLLKWKNFFQSDRPLVLSEEMQEGLYGELIFLEKMLNSHGARAVLGWVGSEKETHDFHFSNGAVEVKTTAKNEPYFVKISNEYQLDYTDVSEKLYLYAIALKKGHNSGERIPEKIATIRNLLDNDQAMKTLFDLRLSKYGYIDGCENLYNVGFYIRDKFAYQIREGFPRITRSQCAHGISKISYDLALDQCSSYSCDESLVISQLYGGDF